MKILYNIAKGFTIMRQVQRNGFVHVQWGTMLYWHGHADMHVSTSPLKVSQSTDYWLKNQYEFRVNINESGPPCLALRIIIVHVIT